jgi:hypothetical protein
VQQPQLGDLNTSTWGREAAGVKIRGGVTGAWATAAGAGEGAQADTSVAMARASVAAGIREGCIGISGNGMAAFWPAPPVATLIPVKAPGRDAQAPA